MRIAFAAGGTAGHVFPAVAVADALDAAGLPISTYFLGTPAGRERELLARIGREAVLLPGLPFQCRGPIARVQSLLSIAPAIAHARRWLREARIDLVAGFGGYASVGPLLAARTLGIRTAIVDGNARLGLANRWLAPLVDRRYTGAIPIRAEIAAVAQSATSAPRARANAVVFGDRFLDARIPLLLRDVVTHVVHRTTDTDANAIREAYGAGVQVEVVAHADDVASLYERAHFVVARGGASTLAELAITGRPSLIVPLRNAAENHQFDNAMPYRDAGAAIVVEESSWSPAGVGDAIGHLIRSRAAWHRMSSAARSLAVPDTAQLIARDLITLCSPEAPAYELPTVTHLEGAA